MCKYCWILVLVFAGLSGFLAFKFIVVGETEQLADGRTAIIVTPAERDLILLEMRMFVQSVQTIVVAGSGGDMSSIVPAARQVGEAAQKKMSPGLVGKLPLGFKQLGFDTHSRFDQLAMDAEQKMSPGHIFQRLGELMGNCVACHQTYRLATRESD